MDTKLSHGVVREFLEAPPREAFSWKARNEDGLPLLHMVVMNEATPPEDLIEIISALLSHGACPNAKDDDGDTALDAVLQLAEDEEKDEPRDDSDECRASHVASVQALVRCPALDLEVEQVASICRWARTYVSAELRDGLLKDLESRMGKNVISSIQCSDDLLQYLERTAYDEKVGVEAARVKDFLDRGAKLRHAPRGATALLLVVLNPYSNVSELDKIFKLMLTADPGVALVRDGFKLSALQWASDYVNVASQHGLSRPNPAALLALLPNLVSLLPAEMDAFVVCFSVASGSFCASTPPEGAPVLRFLEGDRVVCRVQAPGGTIIWEEGVVVGLWYRERCWPSKHPGAPYEVLLDIAMKVFVLVDDDRIVRKEGTKPPPPVTAVLLPSPPSSAPKAKAQSAGKRFQRRQLENGTWEMLDTVSGKARACSPPDSDDD